MGKGIVRGIMWFVLLLGILLFGLGQFFSFTIQKSLLQTTDYREITPSRARFLLDAIWHYNSPLFSPLTQSAFVHYKSDPGFGQDPENYALPKPYSDFTDFVFGYQTNDKEEFTSPTLAQGDIPLEKLKQNIDPKLRVKQSPDSITTSVLVQRFKHPDTVFINAMVIDWKKWRTLLPDMIELTMRNTTYNKWFDSSFVTRKNRIKMDQENLVYFEYKIGNEIIYAKGIDSLKNNPTQLAAEWKGAKDTMRVYANGIWENRLPELHTGLLVLTMIGFALILGSTITLARL